MVEIVPTRMINLQVVIAVAMQKKKVNVIVVLKIIRIIWNKNLFFNKIFKVDKNCFEDFFIKIFLCYELDNKFECGII